MFTITPGNSLSAIALTDGVAWFIYTGPPILTDLRCCTFICVWKIDRDNDVSVHQSKNKSTWILFSMYLAKVHQNHLIKRFWFDTCIAIVIRETMATVAKVTSGGVIANPAITAWYTTAFVDILINKWSKVVLDTISNLKIRT